MAKRREKEDERIYILSREKPARAVVSLGVPLIAGMMIMVLYNLTDTFFIGLMRDDYQLAAVNLAYPVMMVMIALSNVIGTGTSSLIARSLGAGRKEKAEHALTAGFLLTVIVSILVMAGGLLLLPRIVRGLGARSNTFEYTRQYVQILLLGTLFTMGSYIAGQLLRGEGSVKPSIAGMIAGTAANIALDPLFIFAFGLQIRGAAIATVLGNAISLTVSLRFYRNGRTLLKPSRKYLIPGAGHQYANADEKETGVPVPGNMDPQARRIAGGNEIETGVPVPGNTGIIGEILRVGIPAGLETLLTSAAYIINNNLAVGYGELTVAAMGIAQKILSLGNYIYQGFAAGTQPIMGYNYGAGNYRRMLEVLRAGILVVTGTELGVMLLYGLFAPQLIGLFTDSPDVIRTGVKVLRTVMCILPFVGSVSMSRMSFQAMGRPGYAFCITLVRQLILYVPLLLLLNRMFGFNGMIWAQPVTELVMMAASVGLLYHVIRREERL